MLLVMQMYPVCAHLRPVYTLTCAVKLLLAHIHILL